MSTPKLGAFLCANTRFFFLFFLINLFSISISAQHYWTAGSGNWSDASNWSEGTVPGASDEAFIDNGGTVNYDVSGGGSVGYLTLEDGTLTGSESLTVVDELYWYGGTMSGSGILEVSGSIYIEEAGTKNLNSKTLLVTGDIFWHEGAFNINSTGKLQVDAGYMEIDLVSPETIGGNSGAIFELTSGAELYKYGANKATFGCSFHVDDASIFMNAGEIDFSTNSSSNLESCNLTTSGGTAWNFNSGIHLFGAMTGVNGAGAINVAGASVNLNGNNVLNTPVNLSAGEIGGTSIGILSQTVTWTGGSFSPNGTIIIFSNITVSGITGKNISNGTLQLNGNMDWSGGDIAVNSGATFYGNGGSNLNMNHSSNQTFGGAGTINIDGHVSKSQPSETEIAGSMTFAGSSFKLNTGTVRMTSGSTGSFSSSVQVGFSATFEVNGGTTTMESGAAVVGSGKCLVSGGTATFYSGSQLVINLEITGGTLESSADLEPKNYTQSGGTFTGNSSPTVSGFMNWSSGTISGSGTINVNGTTTWENGTRTLDEKILMLNGESFWNGGDFTFASDGKIQSANGKTMTVDHTSTVSATGTGMLEVNGEVKLMNASATTNLGIQFKLNGIMTGDGTFTNVLLDNYGTVSPGILSLGKITVYQFENTNGTLEIELGGTGTGGTDFDQLAISSSGNFGGTLNVSLVGGFSPAIGDEFNIVDCASCTNKFTSENLPALSCSNCEWQIIYGGGGTTIEVTALLPVELIDFQAIEKDGQAILHWETASEINNEGFEIETSKDASDWKTIGFVSGNGHSDFATAYRFEHELQSEGTHYFRLRQMDFDGNETLSDVRSIFVKSEGMSGEIYVAPNPNDGTHFQILISESEGADSFSKLSIINSQGQVIWENANQSTLIGRPSLAPGVYFLRVENRAEMSMSRFVVK